MSRLLLDNFDVFIISNNHSQDNKLFWQTNKQTKKESAFKRTRATKNIKNKSINLFSLNFLEETSTAIGFQNFWDLFKKNFWLVGTLRNLSSSRNVKKIIIIITSKFPRLRRKSKKMKAKTTWRQSSAFIWAHLGLLKPSSSGAYCGQTFDQNPQVCLLYTSDAADE